MSEAPFRLTGGLAALPYGPEMIGKGHAPFDEARSFGFEKAALEAGVGLADGDASTSRNDAVPRNGLTSGRGRHRSSRSAGATGEAYRASQLTIGDDPAPGDALDQRVHFGPGAWHAQNIPRRSQVVSEQLLPLLRQEVFRA